MSLQRDINSMDEVNNYQIKDSQRKEFMAEYREERREKKRVQTEIYDKSSIIYKELFPSCKGYSKECG